MRQNSGDMRSLTTAPITKSYLAVTRRLQENFISDWVKRGTRQRTGSRSVGEDTGARAQNARMIHGLDGVRGIAILWVFAFHANALLANGLQGPASGWGQSLAEKGLLGVQLFFVLSGFLLALPWMRAADQGLASPGAGLFYRKRARRILPAYWLHLVVLFAVILPLLRGSYAILATQIGQANLALHPLLLQFIHPGTSSSLGLNMALWSLTIEVQFYLLLPLLAPLFTGHRVLIALPMALGLSLAWKYQAPSLLADWVYLHVSPDLLVYFDPISGQPRPFHPGTMEIFLERQLPGEFIAFAMGMAGANLYCRANSGGKGIDPATRRMLDLSTLILLAFSIWGLPQLEFHQILTGDAWRLVGMPLFLIACTLLVLAVAMNAPWTRSLIGNPVLANLGLISYSLYLWHEPVLRLVRLWGEAGIHALSSRQLGTSMTLGCISAVALGTLSFALTERHWFAGRFWKQRNTNRSR